MEMARIKRVSFSLTLTASLILSATTIIFMAGHVGALGEWDITLVEESDSPNTLFSTTSIAVDSSGSPHICYRICGEGSSIWYSIKHATLEAATWDFTIVDGAGNAFAVLPTSIAIDAEDTVHLGFSNITSGEGHVRYANNSVGAWTVTDISDGEGIGAICLDSWGNVHMCYAIRVGLWDVLTYATNAGGTWESEIIDDVNHCVHASMVVDSADAVHIAYTIYDGSYSILHATNTDGDWSCSTVDFGRYGDIALDSADNPRIVYVGGDVDQSAVKCAENNSESWTNSTIYAAESFDLFPSIAIDVGDQTHVSFAVVTSSSSALLHAVEIDDDWSVSIVEQFDASLPCLCHSSIAVDTLGAIHISYIRGQMSDYDDGGGLKYATTQTQEIPELSQFGLALAVTATVGMFLALGRSRK